MHPLDPLYPSELEAAVAILRAADDLTSEKRLITLELREPSKADLRRSETGASLPRRAFAIVLDPDAGRTIEVVIALDAGERSRRDEKSRACTRRSIQTRRSRPRR